MPLSQALKDTVIKEYVPRYPNKRAALMPALWLAQEEQGWLSSETLAEVAELLDMHPTDVAAIASFYTMFHRRPVGKTLIEVCLNPPCLINGAQETMRRICDRVGLDSAAGHGGATTADGQYTVRPTECVAACDKAPAVQVDSRYYGPIWPEQVDEFLARMERFNVDGQPAGMPAEPNRREVRG